MANKTVFKKTAKLVVMLVDPCSKSIQQFEEFLVKISNVVPFVDKSLAKIKEYERKSRRHMH